MSRYSFSATYKNEPVDVVIGWDPPLQGFFMYVERLNGQGDDDPENYVWSNLYDADESHPATVEPFIRVLHGLNIRVPEDIVYALREDPRAMAPTVAGEKHVH